MSELVVSPPPAGQPRHPLAEVLNGCNSEQTRRAYAHALESFFRLHEQVGLPPLTPALVVEYRRSLLDAGKSASTIKCAPGGDQGAGPVRVRTGTGLPGAAGRL